MAKRGAQSELNRDNWDQEEEVEEAGTFTTASEEDINKRKIIKARRRIPPDVKPKLPTGGAFKNFTGFSGFAGFNANTTTSVSSTNNSPALSTTHKPESKTSFTGFAGLASTTSSNVWTSKETPWLKANGDKQTTIDKTVHTGNTNESDVYLENIKALNTSVSSWIQKHLDDNPYVDLTPVFNDYRKHLADIESKVSPRKLSPDAKPLPSVTPPSASNNNIEANNEPVMGKTLVFQASETSEKEVKNEERPSVGFPATTNEQETKTTADAEGEPGDEPPKPKSVVSAEEGSKFSVRCKLFFNRNNSWSELGVGMLNIRDIEGKSQLLVRADTATGNILLNVFITSTTPITRNGKNNIMLVSIPNPPLYSKPSEGDNNKPATYLIRVKTAESTDELFKIVEEIKSS